MDEKAAYEKKVQAQLDEWNAEIKKLKAKADRAEAEAQIAYYQQIDELQDLQNNAANKLIELKKAGDNAWHDLKTGVEVAKTSLEDAVKSAASRFSRP